MASPSFLPASPDPRPLLDPFAPPAADLERRATTGPESLAPARRWTRLGAKLVDWLLLAPGIAVGCVIASAVIDRTALLGDEARGMYGVLGGLFALPVQIYQWYAVATRGQSLGKRFCNLRVVRHRDGSNPGFVRGVLLRSWLPLLVLLTCAGLRLIQAARLVNLIDHLAILSPSRRMVHDLIAGTRVVSTEPRGA